MKIIIAVIKYLLSYHHLYGNVLYGICSIVMSYIKCVAIYTILPKVLGHPLLMKGLTTLVISMRTNLNV